MRRALLATAACVLAAAAAVGVAAGGPSKPAAKTDAGNAFGIVVARFAPGTSAAQMARAVSAAGGVVTTDLSKIDAVAAAPVAGDFAARLRATKGVTAVFPDRVVHAVQPDAAPAGDTTGNNQPGLGNGPVGPPDPWHNLPSFLGETNPEGILQWDDNRMNVPAAWATAKGAGVKVAVIDTGVQGSHKELLPNYDNRSSANTIPCNTLTTTYGNAVVKAFNLKDCSSEDTEGHGTWVASRILGAANGFASNGVAPQASVIGYKVLSTGFGGLTSWIVDAMIRACDADVDLINMSLGGYDDLSPDGQADYLVWVDAVNYCRSKGTAIFAAAGNEHVRINRVDMTVGGRALTGVGRVALGDEGISSVIPGSPLSDFDLRGLLETPAGVPGVVMVSATNNANGALPAGYPPLQAGIQKATVGARDQLSYYSNYGARIDIAAPGGARKIGMPRYDVGNADILYGGWGSLGALDPSGEICTDPALASLLTFACFKVQGAGFGWLQGTSMSSPNAAGVAALTLAAHPSLAGNPDGLLARLQSTARTNMTNLVGPNDPTNTTPSYAGVPCSTGFCHLLYGGANAIPFADAYGAGIVNAGAAVAP